MPVTAPASGWRTRQEASHQDSGKRAFKPSTHFYHITLLSTSHLAYHATHEGHFCSRNIRGGRIILGKLQVTGSDLENTNNFYGSRSF